MIYEYEQKKKRKNIGSLMMILLLIGSVGFLFCYAPHVNISFSKPEVLASGTDPTKSPEGKAPEGEFSKTRISSTGSAVEYDLPPEVSNPADYFALEWVDYARYAIQHPCSDFEIFNVDPGKIIKVKVNWDCLRYEDQKYHKWYFFPRKTILLLTPGRYFFPTDAVELYDQIVLQPNENPLERAEIEVYNLDRIVFIPQAILQPYTIHETYLENTLLFRHSPGW